MSRSSQIQSTDVFMFGCSHIRLDLPLKSNKVVDSDDNLSHAWFWLYNKKKMSSKDKNKNELPHYTKCFYPFTIIFIPSK